MTTIGSSLNQAMGGFGIGLLSGGSGNSASGLSGLGNGLSGMSGLSGLGSGLSGMTDLLGMGGLSDMSSLTGDLSESSMGGPQQLMSMLGGGFDMGSLGLGSMPGFGGLQGLGGMLGMGSMNGMPGMQGMMGMQGMPGMQGGNSVGNMLVMMQKMMDMMSQMLVMLVMNNMMNSMNNMMNNMMGMMGGANGGNGSGADGVNGVNGQQQQHGSGSGSATVDLARKYLGQTTNHIKGLNNLDKSIGLNKNCANFVSACLQQTGRLQGHYNGCKGLEAALKSQGWKQVPASQAQPGDVWFNAKRGHTELVEKAGNPPTLIGSNNGGDSIQEVSEDRGSGRGGVFYHKA